MSPLILSTVVHINSADFWLTADGGFLGPNSIWKEIVNVKPSCTIMDPGIEPVTFDFVVVIRVLQELTAKEKFLFPEGIRSDTFQALTHIVPGGDQEDEDVVTAGASDVTPTPSPESVTLTTAEESVKPTISADAFSFECWPLTKEKNQVELLALKTTHHIVPLPTYDLANDLIRPGGAIVEVHFTLSHWAIATTKHDVYGGDIDKIGLLVPPTWTLLTKKRKIAFHLDMEDMPSQKLAKM
ncbi:hypothetical protein BKA83DRAFT_4130694 [Pisolithus microcarpus]|nr:hypothetical protein BKA83DRAFT_4130694 [Pisolithus microcarpus]